MARGALVLWLWCGALAAQAPAADPAEGDPPAAAGDKDGPEADSAVTGPGPRSSPARAAGLDALFAGGGAAAGSLAGVVAVAGTGWVISYILSSAALAFGYTTAQRYAPYALAAAVSIVGVSTLLIPLGAAFGMWWGAGIRGVRLSLVGAIGVMTLGLLVGASLGATVMLPVGVAGGAVWALQAAAADRVVPAPNGQPASLWVIAGLYGPAVGVVLGTLAGAAIGPVVSGAYWGYRAVPLPGELGPIGE